MWFLFLLRYQYFDILRWIAIVLMVLFHLNYSLVHIFESEILNISDSFWYILGKISALGFINISGASYYLASQKYSNKKLTKKYIHYSLILALCAGSITLVTAVFIPSQIILFGILHFFALSFLLLPFITRTKLRIYIIMLFLWIFYFLTQETVNSWFLFPAWFVPKGFYSADYYPLIPYFGVILLWFLWAEFLAKKNLIHFFHISREMTLWEKILSQAGKHSLLIYLIHQPVILTVLFLIFSLTNNHNSII